MAWRRLKNLFYERILRPILFVQDSPRSKAGGVALGLFVAFTPTVGVQMPIAFVTATVFGVNQPLALAMVWITNPVTVPAIYYCEYRVGTWMLGMDAIGSQNDFWREWERISAVHPGYLDRVLHLAKDVGYPLVLGSLPVSVLLAVLGYPITLWFLNRRARRSSELTLHPVAGEILPEPTHPAEAGGAPVATPGSGRARAPPDSALLGAFVAALLAGPPGCTESANRYTTREPQIEARTEGDLELHYAWPDPDTVLVVGPLHAAGGRRDFSASRLDALTHAGQPRLWLTVTFWRFAAGAAPLDLGSDGVRVAAEAPHGKVESVAPSKLLDAVDDPAARPVVATITGAGRLPPLSGGRSLQLVVALPTAARLAELRSLRVVLPDRTIALARTRAVALLWDEFRSQPSRERLEAVLGSVPVAAADRPVEGSGGSEREPGK